MKRDPWWVRAFLLIILPPALILYILLLGVSAIGTHWHKLRIPVLVVVLVTLFVAICTGPDDATYRDSYPIEGIEDSR